MDICVLWVHVHLATARFLEVNAGQHSLLAQRSPSPSDAADDAPLMRYINVNCSKSFHFQKQNSRHACPQQPLESLFYFRYIYLYIFFN